VTSVALGDVAWIVGVTTPVVLAGVAARWLVRRWWSSRPNRRLMPAGSRA
jgi:hypothetical protein